MNDRFAWALQVMNIQPHYHVFEIGCGVGLAVEQIAPVLTKGSMLAIDRSSSAIDKAIKRNAAYKNVAFIQQELQQLKPGKHQYDVIFAFNVNIFWTQRSVTGEMQLIGSHLSKKGLFYLLYGPLIGGFDKIDKPVHSNLSAAGFTVQQVLHERTLNCCCFVVTRS